MSELVDRPRRQVARFGALTALVAALAGAVWWSGTLSAPERLLARSYQAAIADAETSSSGIRLTPASLTSAAEQKPVDAIWPGPAAAQSLAFHRPLKIGDRISISSRDGKADRMSVVELQQIDGAGIGAPGLRFQLVTSRQDGVPEGQLVRFLIAVDGGAQAPAGDKTL
jgi:hypothetical protein